MKALTLNLISIVYIKHIRKHLDLYTATGLANALVNSRLDYCNSLFYAVNNSHIAKLQRVQNCLARVVTRSSYYMSSKPLLNQLHWLPVRSRICFKLALIVFKSFILGYPSYLSTFLMSKIDKFSLRSSSSNAIKPGLRSRTNYGEKSFSRSGPKIWNNLPLHVRSATSIMAFRKSLKTFYFKYPP